MHVRVCLLPTKKRIVFFLFTLTFRMCIMKCVNKEWLRWIWEREKVTFYSVFYNSLLASSADMLLYWFIINVTCAVLLWITVIVQKTAHYRNSVLVVRYELYIYQTAISILKVFRILFTQISIYIILIFILKRRCILCFKIVITNYIYVILQVYYKIELLLFITFFDANKIFHYKSYTCLWAIISKHDFTLYLYFIM